jgi:hypothetical protein
MLRIRSKGVFRDMSLTVPFFERKRFGTRPDLVFVLVCESFFQAVKKRGDRHPPFRIGLAPRPSGSATPCDAGSLDAGSRSCRFKVSDYHR